MKSPTPVGVAPFGKGGSKQKYLHTNEDNERTEQSSICDLRASK